MELTDTHTHTMYSGHGEGEPKDTVAEAVRLGLTTFAITEHLVLPANIDPEGEYSLLPDQVYLYQQQVRQEQEENLQLDILLGVEVDWRDGAEGFILEQLGLVGNDLQTTAPPAPTPYQLILGSVHALTGESGIPDGFWPFDTETTIEGWQERSLRYVWEHYVKLWLDAVNSNVPFDIMAHPDLPKKLGFAPDFDASYLWQQMAEAAAANSVIIECSTAGLYAPIEEIYPNPDLLSAFCRAGVPCTTASDAHAPGLVARDHDKAVEAMYAAGYRVVTVPTGTGDRRQIEIR
ncbi:MAG: PHP domain-containing protein [Coriobacteriia bacterium]|nr:PHP domain-containing protein [Coriobacteriia bacterium]